MSSQGQMIRHRFGKLLLEFRPITPADEEALVRLFLSHSEETVINRYFVPLKELSAEQRRRFVEVNHRTEEALIGYRPEQPERLLGVGRYMETGVEGEGELAVTVHDHYQGRGIGRFLLMELIRRAKANGLKKLTAYCLRENRPMLSLLQKASPRLKSRLEDGVFEIEFPLA